MGTPCVAAPVGSVGFVSCVYDPVGFVSLTYAILLDLLDVFLCIIWCFHTMRE